MSVFKNPKVDERKIEGDIKRHRQKVRNQINEKIKDIVGGTDVITGEKKTVKVRVKELPSYYFRHIDISGGGLGQGNGNEPGDESVEHELEIEVPLEEIAEVVFQSFRLPNLLNKGRKIVTAKDFRPEGINDYGPDPKLLRKLTVKEAVERTESLVRDLHKKTGHKKDICRWALSKKNGDYAKALKLLQTLKKIPSENEIKKARSFIITDEDLRFRLDENEIQFESNALIIAMRDVSGSMTEDKKYITRVFFWWTVLFLRTKYKEVEIRFISHDTEAKEVDEHSFFYESEGGGTRCHSAYDLAKKIIEEQYNLDEWNIYAFHFSDGEDWDPVKTIESIKNLLPFCNALGYAEIQGGIGLTLLSHLIKELSLQQIPSNSNVYINGGEHLFLAGKIDKQNDILPILNGFFNLDVNQDSSPR